MTDANHTILTINCNATAQFALGLTWTMLFIYPLRLAEADIADRLEPLFAAFARERQPGKGFGDFCDRSGRDALLDLTPVRLAAE